MFRSTLTATLAAAVVLSAGSYAQAGKSFGINLGGVKIGNAGRGGRTPHVSIGGGAVKIGMPGHGKPIVIKPPVHKPPIIVPPRPPIVKPPIVIRPKPPIVCPPKPPVHPPIHPPIVIHPPKPPIVCPKPPIVIHPPKPPVVCPPPVITPPPVVHPPVVVCPPKPCGCTHHCTCKPAVSTYAWYFGISLERVQTNFGVGLRVASVTPGGPSQQYGLKPGDVLLVAGVVNLSQAISNTHGVELVQSAVTPEGTVQFTLLDGSTGMLANLAMAPTPLGAPGPAPTAAPIALNPAQPTSTL